MNLQPVPINQAFGPLKLVCSACHRMVYQPDIFADLDAEAGTYVCRDCIPEVIV